jgi:hypothetical protein
MPYKSILTVMVGPLKDLFHRMVKQSRGELPDYYTQEIDVTIRSKIILHYYNGYACVSKEDWRKHCQRELDPTLFYEFDFNEYLLKRSTEEFLSALQILLLIHLENARFDFPSNQRLQSFIGVINKLFQIEKVGYEISIAPNSYKTDVPILIVPYESKYLCEETIQKTRILLYNLKFEGALNEFDKALDDLRFERYEDCIHKAGKAYESILKAILDKKTISYNKDDKIFALLIKVRDTLKLKDPSLNTLFERLWPVLEQGPNIIRNFEGIGHGQGTDIKKYEKSYANFVLHLTGTYIVFLLERFEECV